MNDTVRVHFNGGAPGTQRLSPKPLKLWLHFQDAFFEQHWKVAHMEIEVTPSRASIRLI
jgi:hypothetical protein